MEPDLYSLFEIENDSQCCSFLGTFSSEIFALEYYKEYLASTLKKKIDNCEEYLNETKTSDENVKKMFRSQRKAVRISLSGFKKQMELLNSISLTEESFSKYFRKISGGEDEEKSFILLRHKINECFTKELNGI